MKLSATSAAFIAAIFTFVAATAQKPSLEKLWETDSVLAIPESVLVVNGVLYISVIDGSPWEADGKGAIAKMDEQGKDIQHEWVKGLNAPKGMAHADNLLYIADLSDVVVVDMDKGSIVKKIPVENATGLNDVTVMGEAIVFVSDSRTGRIWKIENDKPELYLDNVKGVNGLKAVGDTLYIGAGKMFVRSGPDKKMTDLAEVSQGIDGIEPVGNGDFILTAWPGYIWYVSKGGKVQTLLETHAKKINSADIGYDPGKRIIYVPTFNARTVVAYALKQAGLPE